MERDVKKSLILGETDVNNDRKEGAFSPNRLRFFTNSETRSEYRDLSHQMDVSLLIIKNHHNYIGPTFFLHITTNV